MGTLLSTELLSSTAMSFGKEVVDALTHADPLFAAWERVHGKGKPNDAGAKIIRPLAWNEHSSTTGYETGYEVEGAGITTVLVTTEYDWSYFTRPVIISHLEEEMQDNGKRILDILAARVKSAMTGLARERHRHIVQGGVLPAAATRSLGTLATAVAAGYLEAALPAAQTHTVGTITKTSTRPMWVNQYVDVLNAFGTNGLAAMDRIGLLIRDMLDTPDDANLWLLNIETFQNLRRALRVYERADMTEKKLDGGRMVLEWDGAQMEVDSYMPANRGYRINLRSIFPMYLNDLCFKQTEFVEGKASGQDVRRQSIKLSLQLIADALGDSAVIANCDTY